MHHDISCSDCPAFEFLLLLCTQDPSSDKIKLDVRAAFRQSERDLQAFTRHSVYEKHAFGFNWSDVESRINQRCHDPSFDAAYLLQPSSGKG